MYILKNAYTSISRNIGRNLLIGIIIIVISCATTITLAIRNSSSSLIESYENQYDVVATIGINRTSMRGEMRNKNDSSNGDMVKENIDDIFSTASSITVSDIENYGNSQYVKDYYYQISVGVNSNNITAASMTTGNGDGNDANTNGSRSMPDKGKFTNMSSGDFTLVGYSSLNAMEEFIEGKYTITSGEVLIEENNCIINYELATLNSIEIGDEIIFINPDDENNSITLKVSGIYDEVSETSQMMGMYTSSVNNVITSATILNTYINTNEDIKQTITPSFVLTDKSVIDFFSAELTEKGLSEYLSISTNLDQVENATSTIANVKTFATTFLVITLIIGGIVLLVINMINIRERKYEIGVLRTIGMKKSLLSMQFITELLIVTIISLILGAAIGSTTSVGVSNYLLENEITNAQISTNNIQNNFGGDDKKFEKMNGTISIQAFDSIDAVVDIKVLIQLLGIGLLLTLISSTASMISIEKFSPLTILKERS